VATDKDWKEAVIDACVINCIGWHEDDPRKTIHELISWEVAIALDPRVSEDARKLRDTYRGNVLPDTEN
jgi:hypothetical protein